MNNPEISVVMTVFNGEKFIQEAIESILNQTFGNLEFIIVDNASTDKTVKQINSYRDPRVVLIRNRENLGQTKALNIGLRNAKGRFIARMDADDISLPERLRLQYEYLSNHDEIAVLGSWYLEIDEGGTALRKCRLPCDPLEIKCYLTGSSYLSYHCISHPMVLMRKSALFEAGLYNERYIAQDYDLWVRLSSKYYLANIKDILYKYRIHKNSQTAALSKVFEKETREVIENNIKFYCPELEDRDKKILSRMLNFLPQESYGQGKKALVLFDRYFNSALAQSIDDKRIGKIKNKLKMYYLPLLFRSNKWLCVRIALRIIRAYPGLLLEKKFYTKIIKSFFRNRALTRGYAYGKK